jgi:hypothetical protein
VQVAAQLLTGRGAWLLYHPVRARITVWFDAPGALHSGCHRRFPRLGFRPGPAPLQKSGWRTAENTPMVVSCSGSDVAVRALACGRDGSPHDGQDLRFECGHRGRRNG